MKKVVIAIIFTIILASNVSAEKADIKEVVEKIYENTDKVKLIDIIKVISDHTEVKYENYEYYRKDIKDTANREVLKLYSEGIIRGDGRGYINPNRTVYIDEVLEIIERVDNRREVKRPVYKEIKNIPIMMYHEIGDMPEGGAGSLWVSEKNFRAQLDELLKAGYNTVTMEQVYNHWEHKAPLPENPIVLTFDDGYFSHFNVAMKELNKRGMTGTFYLITSWIDPGRSVKEEMVKEMYDLGMEVASHTVNHVNAKDHGYDKLLVEYKNSKERLEGILEVEINHFCYPFGGRTETSEKILKEVGYKTTTVTTSGVANKSQTYLRLQRITVHYKDTPQAYMNKIKGTNK